MNRAYGDDAPLYAALRCQPFFITPIAPDTRDAYYILRYTLKRYPDMALWLKPALIQRCRARHAALLLLRTIWRCFCCYYADIHLLLYAGLCSEEDDR